MLSRRRALVLAFGIGIAAASASGACAAEPMPFTTQAFATAQKAGKAVFVDVRAPWCPICKRQAPVLAKLFSDPRFRDVQRFEVDFDTQKDALHSLGASVQSTLITFKGAKETGRSIGQTQPEWLEDLLEKLL